MFDYLIISLAVLCFVAQFVFTKCYEGAVKQTLITTLVMLVVTSFFGMALYLFVGGFRIHFSPISFIWAILFAILMIPYYTVGIKVISLGSLAMYSMFMMLGGMLVPFFYGIIFLQEEITVCKIIGTVFMSLFIVLQAVWADDSGEKNRAKNNKYIFFALCLVIFFLNGSTGVIAKAHQMSSGAIDEISFTIIACGLNFIFSIVLLVIVLLKNTKEKIVEVKSALRIRPIIIMALIGMSAHTGNFLHLKVASNVPASVQFPLVSGGVILISAISSVLIFKEKNSFKEWLSVIGAFLSTVLFAF